VNTPKKNSNIFNIILRKGMNGFGYLGIFFVIYAALGSWLGFTFTELEKLMIPASYYLTLFGVVVTCSTVYMYKGNPHPPEQFSKYVSAPTVIIVCIVAGWIYATRGSLPTLVINGLAMLGLAGAFFRIQTSTTE
jgi:hypothetical protein